jgi:hypothetical protein
VRSNGPILAAAGVRGGTPMGFRVEAVAGGHRLVGPGSDVELANRFLDHLVGRNFAPATLRAYA